MENKKQNTSLQGFFDFIENSKNFRVFDKENDNFTIEAPNQAVWQIQYEIKDKIDTIVFKTIEQLEEFNADERFTEWWSIDFAERNHFKPSQFITMLKEDEASFKELARELRKLTN